VSDVAIVGGGIVGCSLAALLAEAGAAVTLYEREAIAAAASGRNSGALQHPMDEPLVPLYAASLELYRELEGFALPEAAAGVLVISDDAAGLEHDRAELAARFPEVAPEAVDPHALEPALAEGLAGYRLDTGRPVPPAAATTAFAERARAAGAQLRIGTAVGDVAELSSDLVVIAAGPWAGDLIGAPIAPLWGVVVEVGLPDPPRHVVEQAGVEALVADGGAVESIFSIVTADGVSSVGSTFLADEPDARRLAPLLLERGARYLPALAGVRERRSRACPRPLSADGRPLLGQIGERLWIASGHGPWGISLGPGSARLVADAILGADRIPPALAAGRFGW
jgi:glycine/D-amino acid oxidase-like deaminating enzyme